MNFTLHGCKISVSFYFFAVAAIISFFDRSGMMPAGILSALLHESGHLIAMMIVPNQRPEEVSITPFGMKIKSNAMSELMRGRIIVLAAGSAVNLAIAALCLKSMPQIAAMNFVLGATNLLPVDTLDGGGIAKILLHSILGDKSAEMVCTIISLIVLSLMAFAGVYILFRTKYNFTLLGMSLWMLCVMIMRLIKK